MSLNLFNVKNNPADNGSNALVDHTIGQPTGIAAGYLMVVYIAQRGTGTCTITTTGGQTWNTLVTGSGTSMTGSVYWATYNGTWVNPVFTVSTTLNSTSIMLTFLPNTTGSDWALGSASYSAFANPAVATTVTFTGITPIEPNNVSIAFWQSADDNTWGTLTGTNWLKSGTAQFRNLAGNDSSLTWAYQIQDTGQATNNVSQTQLLLGADETIGAIFNFYEVSAKDPMGMMGLFGL